MDSPEESRDQPPLPSNTAANEVEWCNGLPLVEERSLTPDEIALLQSEARQGRVGGCAWGCGIVPAFLVMTALAAATSTDNDAFSVWQLLIFIALIVVPGAMLLRANDLFKWSKQARNDLQNGHVKRFASQAELSRDLPEHGNIMEVLPVSGRVWNVNGQSPEHRETVSWSRVATPPEAARTATHWLQPVEQQGAVVEDAQVEHGRRELSTTEVTEIQQKTRRLWRPALWPCVLFTLWLGVPFTIALITHTLKVEPLAYFLMAVTVLSYYRLITAIIASRRLSEDARNGFVTIVRVTALATPEAHSGDSVLMEVLPRSQWLWSENGRPAMWRTEKIS